VIIVAVLATVAIAASLLLPGRTPQAPPKLASAPAVAPAGPMAQSESQTAALRRSVGSARAPITKTHSVMAAEHEGVRVAINLVSVDHVPIDDHGTTDESEKEYLMVGLALTNKTSRPLTFSGWGHGEGVTLADNLGNTYGRIHAPSGTIIVGQCETATMIGGRSVSDMLVFKPPSDSAEYLTLELPAANFGHQGTLAFKILRLAWLKNNDGG
jgi:hypothetical protein